MLCCNCETETDIFASCPKGDHLCQACLIQNANSLLYGEYRVKKWVCPACGEDLLEPLNYLPVKIIEKLNEASNSALDPELKKYGVVQCPGCFKPIQITVGCVSIKCQCQTIFCEICLKKLDRDHDPKHYCQCSSRSGKSCFDCGKCRLFGKKHYVIKIDPHREVSQAGIPEGWEARHDPRTNRIYYYNKRLKKTSWNL